MKKLFFTLFIILSFCNLGFSQSTIDSRLQTILNQKSEEMIPINIIFKSQIDITKLKTRANATLDKKVRRDMLVDEFKLFSEEKQQDVLSILQAETRSYKVSKIKTHWLTNSISCNADRNVIYLLSEHPDIEIIGYDEMVKMVFEENVILTQTQADEEDDLYLTDNILMINADKVWKMGYTGKGVIVAVIDSGVNYNHTDLADHLWDGGAQYPNHGYNTIDDNFDTMDRYSHGTHCAGTVCGDGTSGIYTGIAPDATLMCVKALNDEGKGNASSIVAAMEFAIENHADILNMSLGIAGPSVTDKTLLRRSCVNALEHGVIAAVAAGNYGNKTDLYQVPNNILAPADCPPPWLHPDQQTNSGALSCVVAVGAIDWWEELYEGSSKGPVTWTDTEFNDYPYNGSNIGLIRPDVCAPGVGIKSLDYYSNNEYILMTGTSMAAPCIAGVMALMLEQNPNLTPAEICETLETTAKKLSDTKSNMFGSGLIDAYKAMGGDNPEQPGDEPEQPGDEPEQPGDEPEQPGDEPEQPGDDPEQPGDEPEQPGDEPEQPGDEPEDSDVPAKPKNLVAEALNATTIILEWDAVKNAKSYNVYQDGDLIDNIKGVVYKANDLDADTEYCFTIAAVNEAGKSAKSKEACATTAPDAVAELTSSFRIYPNPANDKLYIEVETEIKEIVVYDIYGKTQKLKTSEAQNLRISVDLSNLNAGVYFIRLVTNDGVITKQFVKN